MHSTAPVIELSSQQLEALEAMLGELLINRLEVTLVPSQIEEEAKRGAKIRVTVGFNPDWYIAFCEHYMVPKDGRIKTIIKRRNTITALNKMLRTKKADTAYAHRILNHVPLFIENQKERFESEKKTYGATVEEETLPAPEDDDWAPF